MDLNRYKVTQQERDANGIIAAPDTLSGSTRENKSVFDRLVGFFVDRYNLLVEQLQEILTRKAEAADMEARDAAVLTTAKDYTDQKVVDIGAADMTKAMYDPTRKEQDIFKYTDAQMATRATTVTLKATLTVDGWVGEVEPYTQTAEVVGLTSEDTPMVDVLLTGEIEADFAILQDWGLVTRMTTTTDGLTASCYDNKPEVDIPLQIKVVR